MKAFTNVVIFDGENEALKKGTIIVSGDKIEAVTDAPPPEEAEVIDGGGRTLMPGLIDAHVHAYASDVNVHKISLEPATLYAHWATGMLGNMLDRGFTSVRDTGGADYGLYLALERGLLVGPRLFYCGLALSPTGGHGDFRHQHEHAFGDEQLLACGCGILNPICAVVDGADSVYRIVRDNLRRGASFIKFMGSGGISSTADDVDSIQFSDAEVLAVVDEVERHGRYCTAHIHPDRALRRAIELGVHCIEHGSLIEPDTARMAADKGTYIVPTLSIIAMLAVEGKELGYPRESLAKLDHVTDQVVGRLEHMRTAGVTIGFGTDLLGKLERYQCSEFRLRSAVFSPFEILRQATANNAEIIGQKGRLGVIKPGAYADILLVDGNPLEDILLLEADGANIPVIMKGGMFHKRAV